MQTIPLTHAPQPAPHHHSELPFDDAALLDHPPEPESTLFTTRVNGAGLFQVYPIKPTSDPDSIIGLEDICESPHFVESTSHLDHNPLLANGILPVPPSQTQEQVSYAPFTSPSIYQLMTWYFSGYQMISIALIESLIANVINVHDFDARDFRGVSAVKELKRLDKYKELQAVSSGPDGFLPLHGWTESSVSLPLPCEQHNLVSESKAPTSLISGLFH